MRSAGGSGAAPDSVDQAAVQALERPRYRRPGTDPGRAGRAGNGAGSNAAHEGRPQRLVKAHLP